MPEVKLVIDGEEVVLAPNGKSQKRTYDTYIEEVLLWNSRQ